MARRRSVVRRAGAGKRITPAAMLAVLFIAGGVTMVAFRVGQGPGQAITQTGDDGAAVAGRVATGPVRAGEDLLDRIGNMWNAAGRVQQLEAENRDLHAWRELAERMAERNARYEALLRMPPDAFGEGANIENTIAAQLVLDSGGPFTRTLVANAGHMHGVRVGFIAVNENGLVGRVVSVGQNSSRVLMLDDYNSRIPVMGEASRVRAVLAGQSTQAPELLMRPFEVETPRLDFIVGAQSLREGERLVTSGDGGLFPRGIPVGVARRGGDGVWRVSLSSGRQPIDFVRLIPFVGIERPEDAPVADPGPPPGARSAVASISRQTTAAPPAPSTPTPVTPPPAATQTQPRATPANTPARPAPPRLNPSPRATPGATLPAPAPGEDEADPAPDAPEPAAGAGQ